jgi:hypothetical protein
MHLTPRGINLTNGIDKRECAPKATYHKDDPEQYFPRTGVLVHTTIKNNAESNYTCDGNDCAAQFWFYSHGEQLTQE